MQRNCEECGVPFEGTVRARFHSGACRQRARRRRLRKPAPQPPPNADPKVLAYLAGVIDSDGCILIEKRKTRTTPQYMAKLIIGQVDPQAVELALATFGGNVHVAKPSGIGNYSRHVWAVVAKRAVYAITQLRPYLRIKGARADNCLALDACIASRTPDDWPTQGRGRSPEHSAALEALYIQSKVLNSRR